MQINGIWAYLVLEILFVIFLFALAMVWLYLHERKRAMRSIGTGHAPPGEVPATTYHTLLEQQIRETEARLAQLSGDDSAPVTGREPVAARLQYLRAEQSANGEGDEFWTRLVDAFEPLLKVNQPNPEATNEAQNRMIKALRTRIQAFETRVANLEQFKIYFFDLKQQHTETIQLGRNLQNAVEKAVPGSEQPPELKEALQRLEQENTRLEQQLAGVEKEFDSIMRNVRAISTSTGAPGPGANLDDSVDGVEQGVKQIKLVINAQDQQIRELHSIIAGLELELEEKNKLQQALDALNSKSEQVSGVLEILEEENSFLQQQISALLSQELEEAKENTLRIEEFESRLANQQKIHAKLETEYAALASQFQTATEELQRLKT